MCIILDETSAVAAPLPKAFVVFPCKLYLFFFSSNFLLLLFGFQPRRECSVLSL